MHRLRIELMIKLSHHFRDRIDIIASAVALAICACCTPPASALQISPCSISKFVPTSDVILIVELEGGRNSEGIVLGKVLKALKGESPGDTASFLYPSPPRIGNWWFYI